MERIVVGYDGSDASRRALSRAAELAAPKAQVAVIHAAPSVYGEPYEVPDTDAEQRGQLLLTEASELLKERGIEAESHVVVGPAADEIIALANGMQADVIVVGRRRGTFSHLLGSVSSKVVSDARCDVLVVR